LPLTFGEVELLVVFTGGHLGITIVRFAMILYIFILDNSFSYEIG